MSGTQHDLEKEEKGLEATRPFSQRVRQGESERRYSEQEMSAILRHAMDLQQARGESEASGSSSRQGFSLGELEQIASEVGIDPGFVREAAEALHSGAVSEKRFSFWGGPLSLDLERVVDGKVSAEEWETLIAEMRRMVGEPGTPRQFGNSLEWSNGERAIPSYVVTLTPKGEKTRIRIMSDLGGLVALFGIVTLPVGLMVGALMCEPMVESGNVSLPVAVSAAAGTVGGLFLLARSAFNRGLRKVRHSVRDLMDKLADMVAESSSDEGEE